MTDNDPNAPWLSLAHIICADAGIPPGPIFYRLEALRDKLDAWRQIPNIKEIIMTTKTTITYSSVYANGQVGASYLSLDVMRHTDQPRLTHALRTEINAETMELISSEVIKL